MSFPGTMSAGFFATDNFISPPLVKGIRFIYVSNGDTNGLFYYLGQLATGAWSNPHQSGQIAVIPSSTGNNPGYLLVNRDQSSYQWYTQNVANSYIAFDIGAGRSFVLSNMLIRHDNETGYYLRNFKIRGSNNVGANTVAGINAATWDDLAVFTNNTAINAPDGWGKFTTAGSTAYRWFQLLQNGLNSNGDNYLVLREVELYGTDITPQHALLQLISAAHLTLLAHSSYVIATTLHEIVPSHLLNSIAYSNHSIILSHGAFTTDDSIHIDARAHNAINDCDSTHTISTIGHQVISSNISSHQSALLTHSSSGLLLSDHKILLYHTSTNSFDDNHEVRILHAVSDLHYTQHSLLLSQNSVALIMSDHIIIEKFNWDTMTVDQWDKLTNEQWDKLG